ncbi:MAG: GvpL/GvpF family gas vesicle protein [Planctomycetota bacterium]
MPDQHFYQYAYVWPNWSPGDIGPGVDPRFTVERVGDQPIAAVASRVALDQFDVRRLQGNTAEDISWLQRVAIRHDEIICQVARSSPVLPLRLGTVFQSRASLLAAASRVRKTVSDYLHTVGNRQEWTAKLYLEKNAVPEFSGNDGLPRSGQNPTESAGADYMRRKKAQLQKNQERRANLNREIEAVENQLKSNADVARRSRLLSEDLTGRPERMVFNGAFLLAAPRVRTWLARAARIREFVRRKGLLLEIAGPWPPYHFCPTPEL